jgi:hypothetical protein
LICGKEKGKDMNKWGIEKRFRLMKIKHLFKLVIILLVLFSNVVVANSQGAADAGAATKNKNASAYQGTLSGEWHGDVYGVSVRGTFSISIAADGTVSGSFSGFESGTISGTLSSSGYINAKGSAGFSDWSGQLNSSGGRLSGSGSWTGYGGGGLWSSN